MPLFKRNNANSEHRDRASEPVGTGCPVVPEREILEQLEEEMFRAGRYGRALSLFALVAHTLSGEAIPPAEVEATAGAVATRLRFCDRVGVLRNGMLIGLLPETGEDGARAVGHRIAADLTIRSRGTTRRSWLAGAAEYPRDGQDPPTLVQFAIDAASR